MLHSLPVWLVFLLICRPPVHQADTPVKPIPELEMFESIIGLWEEVVTHKPAEWTPQPLRQTSLTRKSWTMGGRFLRMEGSWNPGKTDFTSLLTFDPQSKEYRHWYFDSAGSFPHGTAHGKWDEKTRTITWTSTDEDGNKMVGKTKIIDANSHEWTVVVVDAKGKLMLDLSSKNTRRKDDKP